MSERHPPDRPVRSSVARPRGDERTLSERVIDELAAAKGITPIELDRPLNDSVDPDALDALFAPRHDGTPRNGDGYVEFTSNGYRVVVRKGGEIRLEPVAKPL